MDRALSSMQHHLLFRTTEVQSGTAIWSSARLSVRHADHPIVLNIHIVHTQNSTFHAWHCRTLLGYQASHRGATCTAYGTSSS